MAWLAAQQNEPSAACLGETNDVADRVEGVDGDESQMETNRMDRYTVEVHRLGQTGQGGQQQWSAEPVIRVAEAERVISERLACVFASTENEVRALALSSAERWIHDQLIGQAFEC